MRPKPFFGFGLRYIFAFSVVGHLILADAAEIKIFCVRVVQVKPKEQ